MPIKSKGKPTGDVDVYSGVAVIKQTLHVSIALALVEACEETRPVGVGGSRLLLRVKTSRLVGFKGAH